MSGDPSCTWYVHETDTIGEYVHCTTQDDGAFCLLKELFTACCTRKEDCAEYKRMSRHDRVKNKS